MKSGRIPIDNLALDPEVISCIAEGAMVNLFVAQAL